MTLENFRWAIESSGYSMSSMWYIRGVNKSVYFPLTPILSRRDFSLCTPTSLRTNSHIDRVYVKVLQINGYRASSVFILILTYFSFLTFHPSCNKLNDLHLPMITLQLTDPTLEIQQRTQGRTAYIHKFRCLLPANGDQSPYTGPCLTYLRPTSDNTKRKDNTSGWILTGNSTSLDPHFTRGDKIDTFGIIQCLALPLPFDSRIVFCPKRTHTPIRTDRLGSSLLHNGKEIGIYASKHI